MNKAWILLAFAVCFAVSLAAQQPAKAPDWSPWKFLVGEWVAEGSGVPGQGTGAFSFRLDLQGEVLVRRNRSDYPATSERPAFSHEDLMVIYQDPGTKRVRAVYFDNEGHAIFFGTEVAADRRTITFTSDPALATSRFRLTYTLAPGDTLKIKFEMAPPGKPDSFATYLEGSARRKPS
jgi:hypothetical protein